MGGEATLRRPRDGRAVLALNVPMDLTRGSDECVRVVAQTVTVKAMLGALLQRIPCPFCTVCDDGRRAAAVIVETGGDLTAGRIAALRAEHPSARLIAVGAPEEPELFDDVLAQPITQADLEAALLNGRDGWTETG